MTAAPNLKKGDKIGLVAPARKISLPEVSFAIDTLQSWGLKVVLGKNVFGEEHQFSGSDKQRTADFQAMLNDDAIRAVICARGGYGTLRIIDQLDFSQFQKYPKWIIGYSDVTVLHSHIVQNFGIETLHATMPINFKQDAESVETLRQVIFGETLSYAVQGNPLNRVGDCAGELMGGNLSMLYALQGSGSDIDTEGKILFLEDIDEYLYHIDRMMLSLKRANKLSKLAGLLIGGMTNVRDNDIPFGKTAFEIIKDCVVEYKYPICFDFPAGHGTKNLALPLGRKAKLSVTENCNLSF